MLNGKDPLVGFIGQGFIGKAYADDFENRGFQVVRYALEGPYKESRERISECDVVFIAVPTPSTPEGFDDSIVREVISLVGSGKTAVIKSTIAPGTTESIQEEFPDRIIMHSPEFLRAATAAEDAAHPDRNVIGIPKGDTEYKEAAQLVMRILPEAPYKSICLAKEAELIKYAGNCFLFTKVVYANLIHDLAQAYQVSGAAVLEGMGADPRIGNSHLKIQDASAHPGALPGRGAGGPCFIKDFAAFRNIYAGAIPGDLEGQRVLGALECKNVSLLEESDKDVELLHGVYGPDLKKPCDF